MNKLTQAGIGFGLAAGITLFSGCSPEAEHSDQQSMSDEQTKDCSPGNIHALYSGYSAVALCEVGEEVKDIVLPDPPVVTKQEKTQKTEVGQDRGDYYVPLGATALSAGIIIFGISKLDKKIKMEQNIERMHQDLSLYETMDLDTFNFIAQNHFDFTEPNEE